jgi:hypothetical protein
MPNVTNIQTQQLAALKGVLHSNQPKKKFSMTKPLKVLIALFSVMVLYFLLTFSYEDAMKELGLLANVLFAETSKNLKQYGLTPAESMQVLSKAIFKFQRVLITTEINDVIKNKISDAIDTALAKKKELEFVMLIACLKYVVCDLPKQVTKHMTKRIGGTSSSHGLLGNQATAEAIMKINEEAEKACADQTLLRNLNLSTVQGRLSMHRAVKTVANSIPPLQGSMEKVTSAINLQNANVGEQNVFQKIMIAFKHHLMAVAYRLREELRMYQTEETQKSIQVLFNNSRMFYNANGNLIANWSPSGEPIGMYDVRGVPGQNHANELFGISFGQNVLRKKRQVINKKNTLKRVDRLYESLFNNNA